MKFLKGVISNRIRSGELPADVHVTSKVPSRDDRPSADAVRHGRGQSLGNANRSDRQASTDER